MAYSNDGTDSVLEILDAGERGDWFITPGTPAGLRISIRNGTQDSHDIEVTVADPIDWARVAPARISLAPGDEAITSLVVSISSDMQVAAGEHSITLELHDFEGTCFGQLVSAVHVAPVYQIELTVAARDPLIRRDVIEGFIVHCTLVNRGNAECTVETRDDGCDGVSLFAPAVRVPMGGRISFDAEARWASDSLETYPSKIGVRAIFPSGEARAAVAWEDVVNCLGSYVPPLRQADEFPEIFSKPTSQLHVDHGPASPGPDASVDSNTSPMTPIDKAQVRAPIRVQINGPSPYRSAFGRRINPWWPPIERLGRRWRTKTLPVVSAFVLATIALLLHNLPDQTSSLAPFINLESALHAKRPSGLRYPRSIVAITEAQPRVQHHANPDPDDLPRLPSLTLVANVAHTGHSSITLTPVGRPAIHPQGSVWQGPVVHVSAGNIKVYSTADRTTRSFIVTPGFKHVYSADGANTYSMSDLRVGAVVRVFYSYTLGIRHPNAIFIVYRTR